MTTDSPAPVVVVTGANGLVGAAVCAALLARGAVVRAVVRRPGSAPAGTTEVVGDFADPGFAATAVAGADAAVTTVHPMGDDLRAQRMVGVVGTTTFALAAAEAGVDRLVHVSTAGVYDRSPGVGDVDESSALLGEDGGDYAVSKRETDEALAAVDGPTRVLLRPPAILGAGASSVWNTLRPTALRDEPESRHATPGHTFAWVHVTDLAAFAADLATGAVASGTDPGLGPVAGGCTVVNVAADPATNRDYYGTLADALGVEIDWQDRPAWTGRIVADRAHAWGWSPRVSLAEALAEVAAGLR